MGMAKRARARGRAIRDENKHNEPHVRRIYSGARYGKSYNNGTKIKQDPRMVKYIGTLKDILSDPRSNMNNAAYSINNEENSQQGQCGWLSWSAMRPSNLDNMLSQGYNGNLVSGTAPAGGGAITASLVDGGVIITAVPSDYEVFFEQSSTETIMKNSSSQQVRLTLWECWPRKDLPSTISSPYGPDPQLLLDGFADTITDNLAGGSGSFQPAILYNSYGATPFQSGEWTSSFKLKQIHNCVIMPGEQLVHKLNNKKSFLVSKRSYGVKSSSSIQSNYQLVRKCGPVILMRIEGMPCHDESKVLHTGRNEVTNVSTGTYALDVVQTQRINYRVPFKTEQRRTGYPFSNLSTMTLANEQAFQTYAPEVAKTG